MRPAAPYAYLNFVGVAPSRQRQGLGHRLVASGLSVADSLGVGSYLETTNPTNLAFYRSLGFEATNEIDVADDGPHLWAMWRDPATHA